MEGLDHAYGFAMGSSGPAPQVQTWEDLVHATGHTSVDLDGAAAADLINRGPGALQHSIRVHRFLEAAFLEYNYDEAVVKEAHVRASGLIARLEADVLASALLSESNSCTRRKLLLVALAELEPVAMVALLRAAAAANEAPLSEALERLIGKLSRQAIDNDDTVRENAQLAFSALARKMVDTWSSGVLEQGATSFEHLWDAESSPKAPAISLAPERVVQTALETGAMGLMVWGAVAELARAERVRELLGLVKSAPADHAADLIAQQFATPQRLSILLQEEPVDFDAIDPLLKHLGVSAIEPMLDVLINSHARATRRGILERLAKFGPVIGPPVEERLRKEERWFVVRNMLLLLREAGCSIVNVPLTGYSTHVDPRVRREATNILFNDPIARDRALTNAFRDTDSYMIRNALKACRSGLPDASVPVLAKRVLEQDFPPEFRVPSITLLGRSRSILALDPLLRFTHGGKSLFGKVRLAPKSPEMLAALRGLARTWPSERRARVILDLAAASSDPQIRSALQASGIESGKDDGDELAE